MVPERPRTVIWWKFLMKEVYEKQMDDSLLLLFLLTLHHLEFVHLKWVLVMLNDLYKVRVLKVLLLQILKKKWRFQSDKD